MGINLDSKKTILIHKKIIENKGLLKRLYIDFYRELLQKDLRHGKIVELGSGAGFIKKIDPKVVTSDVVSGPGIDKVFSATNMPFNNNSVGCFVMIDVLHHIKAPEMALKEMERCIRAGGEIRMIEPYNSLWGRFVFQNFHHETFNPKSGWKIEGEGRLSHANGAIPWIIFVRDKKIFEKKFPNLKIIEVLPHSPIRYLFSGGLSMPQFLPSYFYPLLVLLEKFLSPLNNLLGMFATIRLEKTKKRAL